MLSMLGDCTRAPVCCAECGAGEDGWPGAIAAPKFVPAAEPVPDPGAGDGVYALIAAIVVTAATAAAAASACEPTWPCAWRCCACCRTACDSKSLKSCGLSAADRVGPGLDSAVAAAAVAGGVEETTAPRGRDMILREAPSGDCTDPVWDCAWLGTDDVACLRLWL